MSLFIGTNTGLFFGLALWAGLACSLWILASLVGLRAGLRVKLLRDLRSTDPPHWPRLSVIVPACNEEHTLASAMSSLIAEDYPDLEIVIVNDRSTDGTGAVADGMATRDSRVRVIHVAGLPPGWLGKVHALHVGTSAATGEWLLYTDADVHFRRGALRRAVAYALAGGIDHFAVAPDVRGHGFWHEVALSSFASAFLLGTRAVDVERRGPRPFVGVGAFNLANRAALDRTPGFAWLRMEVLDDVGLGLMLKQSGARAAFALGLGEVEIDWYGSLNAMRRGLEKNMFGGMARYSYLRVLRIVLAIAILLPGPIVALALPGSLGIRALGLVAILLVVLNASIFAKRTGRPFFSLLATPLGLIPLATFLIRSALACRRQGGIVWRGTFYPLEDLRRGLRVGI